MQTPCIEMALMSQQEQQAFEQELLNAIRCDSDCFQEAKTLLLFAKAFKNIKKEKITYIFS
jgi:hypothetical protein